MHCYRALIVINKRINLPGIAINHSDAVFNLNRVQSNGYQQIQCLRLFALTNSKAVYFSIL